MTHAAMLLASGLAMVLWPPCRSREGRAPRSAIALLIVAPAAVWVGSFGVTVAVAAGEAGGTWGACTALWRQLMGGDLVWWRSAPLIAWTALFPLRAGWSLATRLRQSHQLLGKLRAADVLLDPSERSRPLRVVPGLSTPAITAGLLRPFVLVDAGFWDGATRMQRDVVIAHEFAHARGHHGIVETVALMLVAGMAPLPAARALYDCLRRHLEAIADDAAVRQHGREVVGVALGHIALAAYPAAGLGASGASLWRVHRLVGPSRGRTWRDAALLLPLVGFMAVTTVFAAADAAIALGPVAHARFCLI